MKKLGEREREKEGKFFVNFYQDKEGFRLCYELVKNTNKPGCRGEMIKWGGRFVKGGVRSWRKTGGWVGSVNKESNLKNNKK